LRDNYYTPVDAKLWPLGATQDQQIELYGEAISHRNVANKDKLSSPYGDYRLLSNNCGSWARHMIESAGLTWPEEATRANWGGGIGGTQDNLPYIAVADAMFEAYGETVGRGEWCFEFQNDEALVLTWTIRFPLGNED
jgi:hypothetical protein